MFCHGLNAEANPLGAQVVNGTVNINQVGSTLNITNTPGSIINWQSFSIAAGETTNFIQQSASSAVLNRVVGSDPSILLGRLTSNGQVYLINPAGIMVGQGAVIDVPRFVASALNLSNPDFLAGKLNFTAVPNAGSISNQGTITTPEGGSVYLVAPQVENGGIIKTPKGETILAAGDTVMLVDTGAPGVTVQLTGSANNATNLGQIIADTGRIGLVGAVVKNRGTLNANSLVSQGGRIFLRATQDAYVDGGSITATGTTGGNIEVLGNNVALTGNAVLDASGTNAGGTVLVGGDYQGQNAAVQNARLTYFASTANISANATDNGNGGKVIVWADDTTQADGNISVRGGKNGGDGGFVEVSGKRQLIYNAFVDSTAAQGKTGTLLLDPTAINLIAGAGTDSGNTFYGANIITALNSSNVIMQTSAGGTGNITFTAGAYNFSSATTTNSLSLLAYSDGSTSTGNISMPAGTNLTMRSGSTLTMVAGWDGASTSSPAAVSGFGTFDIVSNSQISAGNLNLITGSTVTITDSQINSSGNMSASIGGNLTLTATNQSAMLKSSGTQTISFTGTGAHTLQLAGSTAAGVGSAGASIESTGLQTIDGTTSGGTLAITLTGGSATAATPSTAYTNDTNGNQTTTVLCTACATWDGASIRSAGGQTIKASTITATGGSGGNGNNANIENNSTSVAQSITTTGLITLTGGTSGGYYNSTYPNDVLSNDASIHSRGTQTINAGSISMLGGGGGAATLAGAFISGKVSQNITTTGNLSMSGGNSTVSAASAQYGLGAPAVIGEQYGANITLTVGGTFTMAGATGTVNPALIGSATGTPTIKITAAGITMSSDSRIGVLTGGPAGTLTMNTTGNANITQAATSKINTASLSANAGTGTINLAGANLINTLSSLIAGSISYNSAQAVHIGTATSTGAITLTSTGAGSHLYLGALSGTTVNGTSAGGIYDDNGSGVTNITATTSSTLISTGAVLGNLGVSADVNTPSITATVSGSYGGISIRSTGASAPTAISLTDSATVTPQGVSFYHYGANQLTLASGMSFSAGSGNIVVNGTNGLTYSGATLTNTGSLALSTSGVMNINSSLSASGDLSLSASDLSVTNSTVSGSKKVSASVSGNMRINATTSASVTAVNDVSLTFSGATSTLYFNDPVASYTGTAKVASSIPQTVYLSFLGRSSGGVVIDGVETLATASQGNGFYTGGTAAAVGAGLVVTYSQQNLSQTVAQLTPTTLTSPSSTTTTTSGSASGAPTVAPVVATATATTSTSPVNTTGGGTIGGATGTFGGNDAGLDGSSASGSGASGSSASDSAGGGTEGGNVQGAKKGEESKDDSGKKNGEESKDDSGKKNGEESKDDSGKKNGKENNERQSDAKPEKC